MMRAIRSDGISQRQHSDKMKLLASIDKTPEGYIVLRANIGEEGYIENVQFDLQIQHNEDGFDIVYWGEDATELTIDETIQAIKLANRLPKS